MHRFLFLQRLRLFVLFGLVIYGLVSMARVSDLVTDADQIFEHDLFSAHPSLIIDYRSEEDFIKGHIVNSFNDYKCRGIKMPLLLRYAKVILVGNDSLDLKLISNCLQQYPNARYISGGIQSWINSGYPIEKENFIYRNYRKGCAWGKRGEEDLCI